MEEIWQRIEKWLEENAPDILSGLEKGASASEIASTEKTLGIKFPADVKESYRIHDGQSGISPYLFGEWQLLSLKSMVSQWKIMKELVDGGDFEGTEAKAKGPVKADWYNLKWIPVAYDGAGNLYCLDMDPPAKGKEGQIVSYWHDEETREKIADSFEAWLASFADDLEAGKYKVEDEELKRVSKKRG